MKLTKAYSCILFDADDTLVEFAPDARRAFVAALKEAGREDEETLRTCVEYDYGNWDKAGLSEVRRPDVQAQFHELYRGHVRAIFEFADRRHGLCGGAERAEQAFMRAFALPGHQAAGAAETVEALRKKYRVYAATNGLAALQRGRLSQFPLDGVFVSEELGAIKPSPAFFEGVLRALGVAREACLMVGDSVESDVRGANAAGLDVVWLNRRGEELPADAEIAAEISDLRELPRLLLS